MDGIKSKKMNWLPPRAIKKISSPDVYKIQWVLYHEQV